MEDKTLRVLKSEVLLTRIIELLNLSPQIDPENLKSEVGSEILKLTEHLGLKQDAVPAETEQILLQKYTDNVLKEVRTNNATEVWEIIKGILKYAEKEFGIESHKIVLRLNTTFRPPDPAKKQKKK